MEKVLIVFMILVCLVCLFAMLVVVLEIIRERKERKAASETDVAEEQAEQVQLPEETAATVAQAKTEQPAPVLPVDGNHVSAESGVSFSAANKGTTIAQKYEALPEIYKAYYDEIAHYAASKPQSKRIKNNNYEEYKLYHARLVRLQIKNDIVVCQYILVNENFQSYIYANKVKVKQSSIALKITGDEALQAAKNSVDIAYEAAVKERERKIQLRREKSKQTREAKKVAAQK